MKINTDGLILKRGAVGESDRLVTVLTRDMGVIRAFVRGANKVKGKSASATDALCYSTFSVTKSKDTYNIDEVTPVEVFFELRSDIEKLSLAQYFCEAVMYLVMEGEESNEALRLILNCLYMLAKGLRPNDQIKAIFELRLMTISGFMPELRCCSECGADVGGDAYFSFVDGTVSCALHGKGVYLPAGVLAALRHISECGFEKLFSFEMPSESLKALTSVTERYLKTHCDREFTALNFYKSL